MLWQTESCWSKHLNSLWCTPWYCVPYLLNLPNFYHSFYLLIIRIKKSNYQGEVYYAALYESLKKYDEEWIRLFESDLDWSERATGKLLIDLSTISLTHTSHLLVHSTRNIGYLLDDIATTWWLWQDARIGWRLVFESIDYLRCSREASGMLPHR